MAILDKKQKKKICGLLLLMFVGSILETISVSAILPFISLILNPNLIRENKYYIFVYKFLNFSNVKYFLIFVSIFLIIIYIAKNIYLLFLYELEFKFVYQGQLNMSKRLMSVFMKKPYSFFLTNSSSEIIRMVKDDITNVFLLLQSVLQVITECIVVIVISIFLLIIDVKMTLFICMLLVVSTLVIKKILQPILFQAGAKAQKGNTGMTKWITQGIVGIKEVKIAQQEETFVEEFSTAGKDFVHMQKKYNVLNLIPRFSIETVCITGLLLYITLLILNGTDVIEIVPQLSCMAMAAVRLMPSANRISQNISMIGFRSAALNTIYSILIQVKDDEQEDKKKTLPLSFTKEIRMTDIEYHYPNSDVSVLKNANIVIPKGMSIGIIGKSGSGKTTLVNILLGLLEPQSGGLYVDDILITKRNYQSLLDKVGYIPQNIFLLEGTIGENVAFGKAIQQEDKKLIHEVLEEAQLKDFVDSLPLGINTHIGENGIRLSGGQRQRLGIARALYRRPEIFIFDEATSSLDNETEAEVMSAINKLHGKTTMVIIAHRLNTIDKCDIVYKIEENAVTKRK